MLQIGQEVDGRYEILKEIGRGGMSIVYLAMDNRLKKSLVVKDIRKHQNINDEVLINSLVVEANMLKKLEHPALPRIYDIIETKSGIYVVMDYIEGESLKEKLDREYKVSADEVIVWARQLADVLGYLHNQEPNPIIYRDMKPDNIMLTPEGNIKLIDFGIAREYKEDRSSDTTNLGTKAYAAPEQIAGKQSDKRTDIYSLGVTLYHLVTGKSLSEPPFEIRPIRTWDPSLPEGLEYIIQRCTQIEPDERYQEVVELAHDLNQINKLTQGYKKHLIKKLAYFLFPAVLFVTFSTTAVFGYNGIQNVQFEQYRDIIREANNAFIDGDESKAINLLNEAISFDRSRARAYNRLLDVYVNRDEADTGLADIESYITKGYGGIDQNAEVLFKVGMTYFDIKKDYGQALKYFRKIDDEEEPEAKYYKILASTMSELNIDYTEFMAELEDFEKYNDDQANNERKVENYNILANIYLSYKGQLEDANTRAISIINKAKSIIEMLGQEEITVRFQENFEQKLAQAYYSRGIQSDQEFNAHEDFYQAIDYYKTLLEMDVSNQKDIMITIGSIYAEIGDHAESISYFNDILERYPDSEKTYIKLINLLIDIEQEKEEGKRNYDLAKQYFEQLMELDSSNHPEIEKLKRRLENNSIL